MLRVNMNMEKGISGVSTCNKELLPRISESDSGNAERKNYATKNLYVQGYVTNQLYRVFDSPSTDAILLQNINYNFLR